MVNKVIQIHNICFNDNKDERYLAGLNIKNIFMYKDIAYLILIDSLDVYEIFEIAVLPEYRNKGIATKLIEKITLDKDVLLEVCENNLSAINLYKKNNFKEISIRKNYYNDKNAIIMKKEMV